MFYREGHRRLFRAMLALTERRVVIDHITLRDELLRRGELEAAGGLEYLAELVDAVPTAANLEFHAKIVRDKAILRRLIEAGTAIITEAYDGHSTAADLLDVAESKIFTDLPAARERRLHAHQGDAVADDGAHRNAPAERQSDYRRAERLRRFGCADVGVPDRRSWWWSRPGRRWGRRRSVSTSPPTRRARGRAVAIFSLEMSKESLVQRMLTATARVDSHRVRQGTLRDSDFTQLARAAGILQTYQLWIDDTPSLTLLEMRSKARRLKIDNDLKLVIVDYLQLMRSPRTRGEPGAGDLRHLALAQGARARAADPGHRAVAALAARSEQRGGERQADPFGPPRLGRHRAGRRSRDVHPPAGVLRPGGRVASAGVAEVMLAKNRNGPTGDVTAPVRPGVHALRQPVESGGAGMTAGGQAVGRSGGRSGQERSGGRSRSCAASVARCARAASVASTAVRLTVRPPDRPTADCTSCPSPRSVYRCTDCGARAPQVGRPLRGVRRLELGGRGARAASRAPGRGAIKRGRRLQPPGGAAGPAARRGDVSRSSAGAPGCPSSTSSWAAGIVPGLDDPHRRRARHRQVHAAAAGRGAARGRRPDRALRQSARSRADQIRLRAERCSTRTRATVHVLGETRSRPSSRAAAAVAADVVVIDSIQTVYTEDLESAPGNVGQVRECAAQLMRFAKESGTAVFVVGHVTKGGGIAGPKTLEHIVDTVLYFEGESHARLPRCCAPPRTGSARSTRSASSRMTEHGLIAVANPSELFLGARARRHQRQRGHRAHGGHAAGAGRGAGARRQVGIRHAPARRHRTRSQAARRAARRAGAAGGDCRSPISTSSSRSRPACA